MVLRKWTKIQGERECSYLCKLLVCYSHSSGWRSNFIRGVNYGRTGLFELLEIKLPIRKLIYTNKDQDDIRFTAKEAGMTTLRDAGILKVLAGITSIDEVARTTIEEE